MKDKSLINGESVPLMLHWFHVVSQRHKDSFVNANCIKVGDSKLDIT